MGSCLPPATVHHRCRHPVSQINSITTISPPFLTSLYTHNEVTSNCIRTRHSFLLAASNRNRWSARCRATSPGPPSPPKLDPPPGSNPPPTSAPPIVALYLVHFIQSILQLFYSEPNASPGGLMLPNLGPLRSNLIIYQTTMKNIEFSETTDNSTKPDPSLDDDQKEKMHKHLGLDIREMMSSLTNHLGSLLQVQKVAGGSSHHGRDQEDTDHEGVRIITLAGNNVGATMRGEMDDQKTTLDAGPTPMGDQPEALNTYVNSNFQAINNSIMMDGCYSTNDPGVHMDISDYMVPEPSADTMHGKKGKKKHKGSSSSESDHHAKHSE